MSKFELNDEVSTRNTSFSVAMCVYGKDDPVFFKTAVDSILNQTVKPAEVVLVVDGPVPSSLNAIIAAFENDPIFHVIRLARNQGHGNARRIGLENCSNELVALMDADDISNPDRFERQLELLCQSPYLSVVGGNIIEFIDTPENVVGARNVPQSDTEIKRYMKDRCPMNQVTVMFKKNDVNTVGGYIDWYCEEDYYLWLRLMLAGFGFANVGNVLVNVRVGKDMYQRRGGWGYFKSEAKLQKFMHDKGIINFGRYILNLCKRLVVQVLMPNKLRGWAFRRFARTKV